MMSPSVYLICKTYVLDFLKFIALHCCSKTFTYYIMFYLIIESFPNSHLNFIVIIEKYVIAD